MLETKATESLTKQLEEAGINEALAKLNEAIEKAGHDYQVKSVILEETYTEENKDDKDKPSKPNKPKPCKCLKWGVIGYDETCYIVNGKKQCTRKYIYGCQYVDCT